MANIVQNAVGTQRQFTRQPVATYQKSLRNLTASQGIVKSGAGDRLYDALTGFGNGLMKYASSEEDRARARTVEVEPLINAATEDDWKKLSALELLNKYGKFQLADNPYAVAAIEQARGKYMSEKFTQQYSLTMAQDPVKDPDKERERYDEEKRKFLEENKADSYDTEQFYKGFWESNPQDLLNITNQKVAEKSKSLDTIRRATFQADATTYVRENADKSPDKFVNGLQQLINKSVVMSYQLDARKAAMEGILEDVSKEVGSPDLIRKCADLVITNDDDGGAPVKLKNVIDLNTYIHMAEDTALAKPNEYLNKQYEIMARCQKVGDLDKWWKDLSPETQHMMKGKYGQYRVALVKQEEEEKKAKIRANQKQLAANQKAQVGDIALTRYLGGHADMTYCTPDQAYEAAARKLSTMQPGDTKTFAKVLMWSPNSRMRTEYKDYFQQSVLGMSPDEMGDTSNPKSVTNALALYNYNPAVFAATFGKDLTANLQAIQALIDFKGSPESGFQLFCEGRDNMARNSEVKEAAENFANNAINNDDYIELTNADTPDSKVQVSVASDAFSQVNSTSLQYLRACTQSDDAASYLLQSTLAKNYVAYDGHPMPAVAFAKKTDSTNGIDATSDQLGAGTEYMDYRVSSANAEYPGMHSTWWWGVDNKIHFGDPSYGLDEHGGYTLDEFYDLVNQWHYDNQTEVEGEAKESSSADDSGSSDNSSTTDDGETVTVTGSRRATVSAFNWNGF